MTLIWGSVSLFFFASILRFYWPVLSYLPLSEFLIHSSFDIINSTKMGVDVIYSPYSTRRGISPNSDSAPISTPSRHIVLHEYRKTCTCLWIQSM